MFGIRNSDNSERKRTLCSLLFQPEPSPGFGSFVHSRTDTGRARKVCGLQTDTDLNCDSCQLRHFCGSGETLDHHCESDDKKMNVFTKKIISEFLFLLEQEFLDTMEVQGILRPNRSLLLGIWFMNQLHIM